MSPTRIGHSRTEPITRLSSRATNAATATVFSRNRSAVLANRPGPKAASTTASTAAASAAVSASMRTIGSRAAEWVMGGR